VGVFENNLSKSVPIDFDERPCSEGSRIGGFPSKGAPPQFSSRHSRFFCSVQLGDGFCVSIFHSFDIFGADPDRDIIAYNNQVLQPSALIHAVVHSECKADDQSAIPSEVSCHRLVFGDEQRDLVHPSDDGDAYPYPRSKVGGSPFIDNVALVGAAFSELEQAGYKQILQFDTPDPRLEYFVEGFPWDPGLLHVFGRKISLDGSEFAFVIQQ